MDHLIQNHVEQASGFIDANLWTRFMASDADHFNADQECFDAWLEIQCKLMPGGE